MTIQSRDDQPKVHISFNYQSPSHCPTPRTILKQATSTASPGMVLLVSLGDFLLMFCVSAIIGILFALVSAVVSLTVCVS